jgi:hypothetical protein
MDKVKLTPANIVILASGVVILIASFLAFYKIDIPSFEVLGESVGGGDQTSNAWSSGLFPVATLVAIYGVLMAVQVGLRAANVQLPDHVAGFTWNQVHLVLGAQCVILMVAFLIQDSPDKGIGFWLMLLASIGLLVGAVMRTREPAGETSPPVI